MIHPRLRVLADEALRKGMEIASQEELLGPILVLQDQIGEVHRYRITLPGVHPSDVMKILLLAHRATHAALCLEGWSVSVEPPADGPERDAFLAHALKGERPPGVTRPRFHPERYDALMLLAQSRGQPDGIYRQWRIEGSNPRRMVEESDAAANLQLAGGRFWPMYVGFAEVEHVVRTHADLARLRDQVQGRRS
jgi:hypothetical protein